MSPKKKKSVKLAPGEFELLELFWERGEMTIAQTHQELLAKGRKAYPTVQTQLNRLVDKNSSSEPGITRQSMTPQLNRSPPLVRFAICSNRSAAT